MARYTKEEVQESLQALRRLCKPGTTVNTVLRHVSRSGMFRRISLGVARKGEYVDITWHVARVLGEPIRRNGQYVQDVGLGVGGCGMDVGYHLVMNLSYALHGHHTRGADASAATKLGISFTPRPGHYRAGYSLKHRWL